MNSGEYRKKPVVIKAVQWTGEAECYRAICELCTGRDVESVGNDTLLIHTLEGDMKASLSDWIIRGVNGEAYPCKPDIFDKTYEPAALHIAGEQALSAPAAQGRRCTQCGLENIDDDLMNKERDYHWTGNGGWCGPIEPTGGSASGEEA